MTTSLDQIVDILTQQLLIEVDDVDMDMIDRGVIDSFGFATLFVALEEEFDLVVQLEDMSVDLFRTPRRIEQFIASRKGAA
jgi:acyl carrier protein